ncbi:polyphosphate kinase 2 [Arcobacter sp. FWKO B]|uniref:polyphosphate kinase 2 n=1 Tax=Arcobacter sp. FWKO B TaxID=2593672 RepID=UPI0018A4D992|nr:polyphosphate kinase 2 [Arcobacter sp. FWKO B]QOG11658.1 polyphosphate kinase 2 [Arcobacter sp. FWKO B]
MNLNEFNKTAYAGLFISNEEHQVFGFKYIARFQLNKKRYVKVLGYSKKNKLTDDSAYALLEKYKESLTTNKASSKTITPKQTTVPKVVHPRSTKLPKECEDMRMVLGNYEGYNIDALKEAIQGFYDSEEMKPYQIELIKMQNYLEATSKKMIILFEGRDASGKGGAIRRITRYMNNKHYRVVALGKPTETQRSQWFFQRYIEHFPTGGEVVLFDRSWYNRAMVEPIFGFCTQEEHDIFMEDVVNFEHDLVRQNIILIKLYFSVSKSEQLRRFERRMTDPLRQWKLSEVDLQAQDLWDDFSEKKYEMLKRTNSNPAPWYVVRSDDKHKARLEAVKIILNSVDYPNRNTALDYMPNEEINISVQKELARMRKQKDY